MEIHLILTSKVVILLVLILLGRIKRPPCSSPSRSRRACPPRRRSPSNLCSRCRARPKGAGTVTHMPMPKRFPDDCRDFSSKITPILVVNPPLFDRLVYRKSLLFQQICRMGDTGLEPVTSSVSCWRASQLRQSPALCRGEIIRESRHRTSRQNCLPLSPWADRVKAAHLRGLIA
jgi:hypothetical protein